MMRQGPKNLITDVAGLTVGNATDAHAKTGVTALICEQPFTASIQVLGGAPGTRESDLLDPDKTVQGVDAIALSGGSAFGLDAASGIQQHMKSLGRGFAVGPMRIPIVPGAILFDLINGGDKNWGDVPPYRDLGLRAAQAASSDFDLGSAGAGAGALTADLKGGLGSASTYLEPHGATIGALVAVNSLGTTTIAGSRHFWAAPFEIGDEFGGLGPAPALNRRADELLIKFRDRGAAKDGAHTTIGIIATDAKLTKAECKRLAVAAHDGFARSIWPSHTPLDGDLVFAVSTGAIDLGGNLDAMIDLSAAAASTMARAIARGVHCAIQEPGDIMPVWSARS